MHYLQMDVAHIVQSVMRTHSKQSKDTADREAHMRLEENLNRYWVEEALGPLLIFKLEFVHS